MKIVRPNAQTKQSRSWLVVVILLALLAGLFLGEQGFFASGTTTMQTWFNQQQNGSANEYTAVILDMDFSAYNTLIAQRNEALADGVFIGKPSDFVPATLTANGDALPVLLRLQSGVATHLGDDGKWNFEVVVEDGAINGLTHFFLMNPSDNQGIYELGYQHSLAEAGLLATAYDFANLFFNGDDLGTYAIQENPVYIADGSPERPYAIITRFDPTPLWQNIIYFGGDEASALSEPVTNINQFGWQFLDVETFLPETAVPDPTLIVQEEQALALLQAFQRGDLPATAVFDVVKYGQFLAISDLWGANEATALENLHFYLNPTTGLLEPIGFNGSPLLANGRIDLKTATFNDPELQTAYVQAVQTITEPEYLAQLQTQLQPIWEQNQAQVPSDAGDIWQTLAQKQTALQRSLHPQQPALAYYQIVADGADSTLQIDVTNLVNLPIEIVGVDVNGSQLLPIKPEWVQGEATAESVVLPAFQDTTTTHRILIPVSDVQQDDLAIADLQLAVRVVGTEFMTYIAIRPFISQPISNEATNGG